MCICVPSAKIDDYVTRVRMYMQIKPVCVSASVIPHCHHPLMSPAVWLIKAKLVSQMLPVHLRPLILSRSDSSSSKHTNILSHRAVQTGQGTNPRPLCVCGCAQVCAWGEREKRQSERQYLSMITGSEGVSLRFPQLFLSQHRLREEKRRPSGKKTQGKVGGKFGHRVHFMEFPD